MIKKLKIKFVALSMASLFVLLTFIVAGMNIINYQSFVSESDSVLMILSQNKGAFPNMGDGNNKVDRLPPHMSPELPYESRYFSVLLNESGEGIYIDTRKTATVDKEKAVEYAKTAQAENKERGFIDNFRYVCRYEDECLRITFLDCGRKISTLYNFLFISIGMSLCGYIIVSFIIVFFSGKFIKPIAESYEKQKRFITDAGHEIKTPLAIINANIDVLEMELGENESLSDINRQIKRLTRLTNDLVFLSRMEESENSLQMIDFPISDIVSETVMTFKAMAQSQDKELVCDIQPMLSLKGDSKMIEQLINILMDNALKYSQPGGKIAVNLHKQNKCLQLSFFNTTEIKMNREGIEHIFERFYRTDQSRNSETGGHGIGLSIAKAIVSAHGGKIQAFAPNDYSFQITVSLNA